MNKQRIKKMLDSHGYTIPKGIAFYDLNAYKKIANRQNSSGVHLRSVGYCDFRP